jgi:hypothetical protein
VGSVYVAKGPHSSVTPQVGGGQASLRQSDGAEANCQGRCWVRALIDLCQWLLVC